MAKIGDDVIEWSVDRVAEWLEEALDQNSTLHKCETQIRWRSARKGRSGVFIGNNTPLNEMGMHDCIRTFKLKHIKGNHLVNFSEVEIKSLHISQESKRKLLKAITQYRNKRKGMVNRMFQEFNDGTQVQRITTTKKPSICQDDDEQVEEEEEDPYDYHGWESDEFDDDAGDESSSDDEVGEYVEPESEEPARHIKETPVVRKGLLSVFLKVEELRAGIAQSLGREIPSPLKQMKPAPIEQEEHIDDIYDVPPEEDDMYEEPSDSSGNAMVIRPPSMDKTIRTSETEPGEYIEARQRKGSDDELYEQPLEGEEISSPSQGMQGPFIATEVVQPPTISRGLPPQLHSDDMYEIPQSDEPQAEQNYEVPDIEPAPPPRPPKGGGGVQNSNNFTPPRAQPSPNQPAQAPRSSLPSKVPGSSKPRPTANKPVIPAGATNRTGKPPSMAPKPSPGTRPIPGAQPGVRKPTPSPSLSNKEPANPQSDRGPMPFPSNRGAMPSPSTRGPTPSPSNRGAVLSPSSRGPTPSPSNRGAVPSPSSRGPTPSPSNMGAVATPSSRGVASPPSSSHSTQSPTESGSADEPLIPLPQIVGSHGQRTLPPPPIPAKTPLDVMKEAPWFQGAVDRKKAEASLKACKQVSGMRPV
ncbi:predicted protein [Nematostella vectensis]|uniref:Uncharacterized protein n=1 Tax=Nematostella vectensis TaxID=45351 RepID=A7RLQ4_NEMVE|nr:predicted protein [Nematostella vectensis]|eukprot:XP_001639795.1 predicted protein [Nematostella vectensis]